MARKKRKGPLTGKQLEEANKLHDEQFGKEEVKTWKGRTNNVYGTERRETLGTGWSKRFQR